MWGVAMGDFGPYYRTVLEDIVSVESIITVHYFEFASDYVFKGEKHDFWEFLYVDKGEVEVMADASGYKLVQGDIVFHKPGEFHSVWANGKTAPNIVVVSFECNSPAVKFFENKILKLSSVCRNLLSEIIKETGLSFKNDPGSQYARLERKESSILGSEQLIRVYIEMLLIQLMRDDGSIQNRNRLYSPAKERVEEDTVNNIIEFLQDNVGGNLSFEDICMKFYMGKTHLKTMFKNAAGMGVMEYFNRLKMEEAKRMIREGKHNFTEISQLLGFSSIYYFSRFFKKHSNMTPTEYGSSIKARVSI
jgi:AraC-type DNA-binding domain-containing proteins